MTHRTGSIRTSRTFSVTSCNDPVRTSRLLHPRRGRSQDTDRRGTCRDTHHRIRGRNNSWMPPWLMGVCVFIFDYIDDFVESRMLSMVNKLFFDYHEFIDSQETIKNHLLLW